MKKVDIMTFHFAHNYGAILQSYALREYIISLGYRCEIVNYMPRSLVHVYSLNPFIEGFHPKVIMRRIKQTIKRIKQYRYFVDFTYKYLKCTGFVLKKDHMLEKRLKEPDVIVYGSDQIWNDKIIAEMENYCGKYAPEKAYKIAYAASIGGNVLSDFQKRNIHKYVKLLNAVSVREDSSVGLLKKEGISDVLHVCDPVFLINKEIWIKLMNPPRRKLEKRFILYYALKEDEALIRKTEQEAEENGLPIYSIHPTGGQQYIKGSQLFDIGPKEFLWLINEAELISTNSFHAIAFSIIFSKKVLNTDFESDNCRIWSLLQLCNAHDNKEEDYGILDFRNIIKDDLNSHIGISRDFLNEILKRAELS